MGRTNTSLLYGREEANPIGKQTRKNIAGLSYRLMPADRWSVVAFAKYYRLYASGPVATDENASHFVSLGRALTVTARLGRHRLWRSLHCAGGVYVAVLLLAMSLTGLTWSFRWYNAAFYKLFGVENTGRGGHSPAKAEREGSRGYASWQAALDGAKAICPYFRQITVSHGTLKVSSARHGNTRATDTYTFHPATGRLLGARLYADADRRGKLRGWIYSVHVGSFGGLTTRVLWFVAALLGALLPLTGYYLWYKRTRRRGRHGTKPRAII